MSKEKHLFIGGAGAVGTSFIYALSGGISKKNVENKHFTIFCKENKKEFLKNLGYLSVYNLDRPFKFKLASYVLVFVSFYFLISHIFSNYIFFSTNSSFFLKFVVFIISAATAFFVGLNHLKPLVHFLTIKAGEEKVKFDSVISSIDEVDPETKYIWLSISSDHLKALPKSFLADLLSKAKNAVVLSLTPTIGDTDLMLASVPKEFRSRIGQVTVPFLSYQAPLKNQSFNLVRLSKSYDPKAIINTNIAVFYFPSDCFVALPNADRRRELSLLLTESGVTNMEWEFSPNALEAMYSDTCLTFLILVFGMKATGWKLAKINVPLVERCAVEMSRLLSFNVLVRYNFYFNTDPETEAEDLKKFKKFDNPNFYPENNGEKLIESSDKFYGLIESKVVTPKFANKFYTYSLMFMPHIFPFDFDAYCAYHFGDKVWAQILNMGIEWLDFAKAVNFPHENFENLMKLLTKK